MFKKQNKLKSHFLPLFCLISLFSIANVFTSSQLLAQTKTDEERGYGRTNAKQPEKIATHRRVALIIGNANYEVGSRLTNPTNDAMDMATTLRELGFDEVIVETNASLRKMESALDRFYAELRNGSIGVFYYAGHGVQSGGENYLLPVDARIDIEANLRYEALAMGKILNYMKQADNKINIVIIDACRNNPFARSWRSGARGLATVEAAEGVLIAYATAPGDVAADGTGRNGTFTSALLNYIRRTPGQDVELMLRDVRLQVKEATGGRQIPWTSSSLVGDFSFVPTGISVNSKPVVITSSLPKTSPVVSSVATTVSPKTLVPNTPSVEMLPSVPTSPEIVALASQPIDQSGDGRNVDSMYQKLEAFLITKNWKKADEQTYFLMKQISNRLERSREYTKNSGDYTVNFQRFPCADLQKLDQLWLEHSKDKFGFSSQLKILRRNGDKPEAVDLGAFIRLMKATGWQKNQTNVNDVSTGYFPTIHRQILENENKSWSPEQFNFGAIFFVYLSAQSTLCGL